MLPHLVLLTLLCSFGSCHFDTSINDPDYGWEEKWFKGMPIDHFSYSDQRTFNMRYLINSSYWEKDKSGPIFFYCGNEGDITLFAKNTGFMWDIAPEFKAMLVFAEHRYYGKTLPFGNESYTSLENVGKLSSEQALADFAVFLSWLKQNTKGAAETPVVAFGGSYGGMLAAWFRIKYPHVVVGSLASSAPILQFHGYTPCWKFAEIITRTFRNSGVGCDQVVKKSWPAIRDFSKTDDGRSFLNSAFKLCDDSLLTKPEDGTKLVNFLNSAFAYLAMIDYPYPTNFLNPVPGWPVKEACKFMDKPDGSAEEIVRQVVGGLGIYVNYTGDKPCYKLDNSGGSTADLGTSGWNFQVCTEMVMPMCQNGTDMFEESPWNFTEFSNQCFKDHKVRPRRDWAMTNYGGDKLKDASNIIFRGHRPVLSFLNWIQPRVAGPLERSNGDLDPWSGGSVTEEVDGSDGSLVIVNIPQSAHHLDLRSASDSDTAQVVDARKRYRMVIQYWISNGAIGIKITGFVSFFLAIFVYLLNVL